jgi:hypothetical protein
LLFVLIFAVAAVASSYIVGEEGAAVRVGVSGLEWNMRMTRQLMMIMAWNGRGTKGKGAHSHSFR